MNILSIGNSFSQDAQAYLKPAANAAGIPVFTVNLMIGGCSLERHYRNMKGDIAAYGYDVNGVPTGLTVSIREVLCSCHWDVVTLQQVSQDAPRYETYQPYLSALAAYVRDFIPTTRLYMHETWAYLDGCPRLTTMLHYETSAAMYRDIHASYTCAARDIRADGVIPSGAAFEYLRHHEVPDPHRDSYHADLGVGRLTLAATWLAALTGCDIQAVDLTTVQTGKPVTAELAHLAADAAASAVAGQA